VLREIDMESFERARWEGLYGSHAGQVFAFAYRRVGREDAADVVAETFLVAWRRIDQVPQEALPWLYAVARNVIGNSRRAAVRREALQERIRSVRSVDRVADPTDEVDARSDIMSAVQLLPEAEREALMLVAWEDLDVRSAASVMGCSPGTLAVRIHRGRRRLRKILSAQRFDVGASGNELDAASGGLT
jgi:RNA polymerase sigma-70 factor, ECF subfamily